MKNAKLQMLLMILVLGVMWPAIGQNRWTSPFPIDTSRNPYVHGGALALDDSDNAYVIFSSRDAAKMFLGRSTDQGGTWTQFELGGTAPSSVDPRDVVVDHLGNVWILWMSYEDDLAPGVVNLSKSIDSGKTFATVFRSRSYADGFFYQKLGVDLQNNIYMLWDDIHLKLTRFRLGDTAQRSDAEVPRDTFAVGSYPTLAISKDFIVHCGWEGILYDSAGYHYYTFYSRSIDTGASFQGKTLVDTGDRPALSVDSLGTIFISCISQGGITAGSLLLSRSINGGISFDPPEVLSGTDTVYQSLLCTDAKGGVNAVWMAQHRGTRHYRSSDGGTSFSLFDFPKLWFADLEADRNGYLYATGGSDSGMSITKTSVILSVAEATSEPRAFSLLQNFPNPFNPSTTIRFSIEKGEMVDLRVYDIIGNEVATLISNRLGPGAYSIKWDAANFSSGVYFVRLRGGEKDVATKKVVLLR